ncbi:MAG: WGR domain-containing protein [Sulfobacillus sp.]|nr:WGR domain-containing protein [Sulfobacillus sp.]
MWWTGTSIDPLQNRYRWYALSLQPTLWGTWECWATWGRIGQSPRGRKLLAYGPFDVVMQAAQRQRRRKERKGYAD